ncbi:MAG: hypothetical protein KF795_00195 [Labilithrix sp.]|nr:hypothetical protein [Labilithrix sp.]
MKTDRNPKTEYDQADTDYDDEETPSEAQPNALRYIHPAVVKRESGIVRCAPPANDLPPHRAALLAEFQRRRRPSELMTTIEVVLTPELAQELLDSFPADRNISPIAVEAYARDMRAGRWTRSHQALAVGPRCERGDGQHRCKAVVASGCKILVQVTQYHDPKQFHAAKLNWDTQRRRTRGNALEYTGLVARGQGQPIAQILSCIAAVDSRWLTKPTNDGIAEMWGAYSPGVQAALELPAREFTAPVRAAIAIAFMKAPRETRQFMALVTSKIGLASGTAALSLVQNLPKMKAGASSAADRREVTEAVLNILHKHIKGVRAPGLVAKGSVRSDQRANAFFLGKYAR